MTAPSPPFKTTGNLLLKCLQSCCQIALNVIKNSHKARPSQYGGFSDTEIHFSTKNSLTAGAVSWCKIHEVFWGHN